MNSPEAFESRHFSDSQIVGDVCETFKQEILAELEEVETQQPLLIDSIEAHLGFMSRVSEIRGKQLALDRIGELLVGKNLRRTD